MGPPGPSLLGLAAARAAALVLLAAGVVCALLPLLDLPGYELAELLTVLLVPLGGLVGVSAGLTAWGRARPGEAALRAGAFCTAAALVPVAIVAARAALGSNCSPFLGLPFVALLPVPTALLSTALGGLSARLFGRARAAATAYFLLVLALLGLALWPLYSGPQLFAASHVWGWFPGPLYDENLSPPVSLLEYRGLTLLGWASIVSFLSGVNRSRPIGLLLASLLAAVLFGVGVAQEHRLGLVTSVADIDRALGGIRATEHLRLHYPREISAARVEQLARLGELDFSEIAGALGLPPDASAKGPIDVFIYRGAEEKGRLTGAASTRFAKPWLSQVHLQLGDEAVLRHELVHAMAAPLGRWPFRVSARKAGFAVQMGLVEGLAEAVDWPADQFTLHEWAQALRRNHLAPDLRALLGQLGFWAQPPARAYTMAGSFLRFLLDDRGPEKLRGVYRSGDFEGAYGESLDQLIGKWERFLETVPLDADALAAATSRFRRPAIFGRPCAREVAVLQGEANQAQAAGNPERAAALFGRCAALNPGDPGLLKAEWDAQRRADQTSAAQETLRALLARGAEDPVLAGEIALGRGDDAWRAGDSAAARAFFEQVLSSHPRPEVARAIRIRLAALSEEEAGKPIRRYFESDASDLSLLGLAELLERRPDFRPAQYLLGLRLCGHGERAWGLGYLRQALVGPLPEDIEAQALRVAVGAELDLGRHSEAAEDLVRLSLRSRTAAEQRIAADLDARLSFERDHYDGGVPGLH
jgi:hypothetical protein